MRNSAVKKLLFAILHIPNQYKTQQMCDKLILEDPGMLQFIPYHYKTQEMCDKAVDYHLFTLESIPVCYKIQTNV